MKKLIMPLEKAQHAISPWNAYIVTTINKKGQVNAGSFCQLCMVSVEPQRLVLSVYKPWDTIRNIRETKEFVVNVPSRKLIQEVWICGDKYAGIPIPYGVDEAKIAGMKEMSSEKVKPPRLAECYAHLECKARWIKDVGDCYLVLGDVVSASFSEGYFDKNFNPKVAKAQLLMQVAGNLFAYPKNTLKADRKSAKLIVDKALEKMGVKVPEELKIYGAFSNE